MDPRAFLSGAGAGRLQEVVRTALREPAAVLGTWNVKPLMGGFGTLAGGSSLSLIEGVAHVGAAQLPWRVVLKALVPVAGHADPTHTRYWKREYLLYQSGLLDDLPDGLRAPRCYGCDDLADETLLLWLEYIQEDSEHRWSEARWALTARHLGQFNGAYPAGRPLPRAPWLGGRRLRTWLERHEPLVKRIAVAPFNPDLHQWWPPPVVDDILRLWDMREKLCAALEQLPQTYGHGDAIRRNLIARRGIDGSEETVGIDWEHAGYYAVGEEVGQTLSVASAFYDVEPTDLPALDDAIFAGYQAGLRDAGWRGDRRQVRFAYAAHAALRNAFNAVGASVPTTEQRAATLQNQGRTWEELAERRAAVRPFLLDRGAEALALLEAL